MLNLTKQQIYNRWDILPQILREALLSPEYNDALWKICAAEHLSEDKTSTVAKVAGKVIIGFLRPDDFTKEVRERIGINQEIAEIISRQISSKIFSPLRLEIEKVSKLPITESEPDIVDLRKPPAPETKVETPVIPAIPKLILNKEGIPAAMPMPTSGSAEAPKTISLEEKPTQIGTVETKQPSSQEINAPEEEGPVIIHKEVEFKPATTPAGGPPKPSLGGLFGFLKKSPEIKPKEAPITARVEMGGQEVPKKLNYSPVSLSVKNELDKESGGQKRVLEPFSPANKPSSLPTFLQGREGSVRPSIPVTQEKPRVVHYSDLRTPLPPINKGATSTTSPIVTPPKPVPPPPLISPVPPTPQAALIPPLQPKPATPPPPPITSPPTKPFPIPPPPPVTPRPEQKRDVKLSDIPIKENGEDIIDLRTMQKLKK